MTYQLYRHYQRAELPAPAGDFVVIGDRALFLARRGQARFTDRSTCFWSNCSPQLAGLRVPIALRGPIGFGFRRPFPTQPNLRQADKVPMQASNRSHVALYVWDYFFISNYPAKGDEKPWSAIERATDRIRESEVHLDPPTPPDVRVRHARRVRSAARNALRNVERLSVQPAQWVVDRLVELEAFSHQMVQELSAVARDLAVH